MKLVLYKIGNSLIVAILATSLISSMLVDSPRICIGEDTGLEKACPSPCVESGEYCGETNTGESHGNIFNTQECSNCLDIDVDLLHRSARLHWVKLSKSNSSLNPVGNYNDLTIFRTKAISNRIIELTCPHNFLPIQSQIESTVLRC